MENSSVVFIKRPTIPKSKLIKSWGRVGLQCAAAACAIAVNSASAGIISITSGAALLGDRNANLITNGSFEVGAAGNQNWTGPGPHTGGSPGGAGVAIPGWTATFPVGAYGWWGPLGFTDPCTDGRNCVYFGNNFTTASAAPVINGVGVVTNYDATTTFTNSSPSNASPVTLSQTLAGLGVGDSYLLDFWASGESFPDMGVFGVSIGSELVYLTAQYGAPKRYYVEFTADLASEAITFINYGHLLNISSGSTELALDDVIVNEVSAPAPVPATLALFGLGLAGLGWSRRKKA